MVVAGHRHRPPALPLPGRDADHDPLRKHRRLLIALGVVALVVVALLSIPQVRSYVTHIGGSPTKTWPLEPYAAGDEPDLRLTAVGDVGYPGTREDATAAAMTDAGEWRPYDALVLLGDNVYPQGDPAKLDETVFEPFAPVLEAGAELWPILGNHDVMDDNADANVEALGMPGRWYSERLGDLLFVALDSNDLSSDQLAWLDDVLADTDAPWKIVALHHPPYSSGYQGSDLEARRLVSPIVERHGVQLVLSGHEHDYERSHPIDGVTYIVSGAGADTRRSGEEEFTAEAWSWHHFLDISIDEDRLVVRAVNQDGRVFDEVTIPVEPASSPSGG